MRKIIRLTESDLTRLVNKVLNEQEIGGFKEPQSKEGRGVEFDYWNKLIVPQLTQQGFKLVDESKATTYKKCPYACCKYMYFNNHSTGVNLFLDCGDDPSRNPWLLKVYYQGNKAVKSFNVVPNSQKASQDAIRYALQLKNKLYPANTVAQPQSNGITESDLMRLVQRVLRESENEMDEASSPAQQAAIAINMKKKGIKPKNESLYEEEENTFDEIMQDLDQIANHFNKHTTEEELDELISEIENEVEFAIKGEELSDDELDELITYADFLVDELVSEFRLGMDLNETLYKDEYGSVQSTDYDEEFINEAEYQGRKVQLGKIMQGDVKKSKVYVKNDKGKVVKVNFGFGGKSAHGKRMTIKKNNPERRRNFRARMNCDNPGPRWKPRYWACRTW